MIRSTRHPTIIVPVKRPEDIALVGPVAQWFADALGYDTELVSIVSPDDDLGLEQDRFRGSVEDLRARLDADISFRLIVSDDIATAFVEMCRYRLTCMMTKASPFDQTHFVGSFASALLAVSEEPVILVGPNVPLDAVIDPRRVFVGKSSETDAAAAEATAAALADLLSIPIATVTVDPKGIIYEHDYDDAILDRPDNVRALWSSDSVDPRQIGAVLATQAATGLLVLTTQAHRNLARICGGSVAMDAIAKSTNPVVVLGPNAHARRASNAIACS